LLSRHQVYRCGIVENLSDFIEVGKEKPLLFLTIQFKIKINRSN